jgi:hypothetical protein
MIVLEMLALDNPASKIFRVADNKRELVVI